MGFAIGRERSGETVAVTAEKNATFVDRLSPEGRDALERVMVVRSFRDGEVVIAQEEASASVYVVVSGLARATIFSPDGKMVAYRDIGDGELFGELAAIDGMPRSANIEAIGDLKVGILAAEQFADLVRSAPDFTWALLQHFSAQSRRMTERIFEFSTMVVRDRLVHELLRLADAGLTHEGASEIVPAPTHFDLATRISTHREAVSREMSRLNKLGLVVKSRGRLVLPDLARLRESETILTRNGIDPGR